jgi:DNA-directed RNA polymerase subunit RPC12/RpoP
MKKVYVCLECRKTVTQKHFPTTEGCNAYHFHRWRELGTVGKVGNWRFHCKRCDITVKLNFQPADINCPAGGLHEWENFI